MLVRPVYNILLLPDVSYYFKKEFFTGFGEEELTPGSDILFIFLKNENEQEEYTEEDFYPIGLSARVDAVSEEDTISVRTLERVEVTDLEPVNGVLAAAASIRPEVTDLTDEEAGQKFGRSVDLCCALFRDTSGDSGRAALSSSGKICTICMLLVGRTRI